MLPKPFALSAKVVIHDDSGRCLLIKRSMASQGNPGKWDLPGGKVDSGESFDEGLLREVTEETGLAVELECVLGAAESEAPTKRVVYLIMGGRLESGEVHLSSEHEDYAWVDRQKLSQMDMCDQFRPFALAYARTEAQ